MSDSVIHHHISPLRTYFTVFLTLMVLTGFTVWVAFQDLGYANTLVAVTVAVIKAAVVAWHFMHLKYSARIIWVVAAAGAIWLVVMFAITLSDYEARHWLPNPAAW